MVERGRPGLDESVATRLAHEPLGTVLAGLPDAVVAATSDGRIIFVNELAEELFGYPPGTLVGRPVQTLWAAHVRDEYARNLLLYFATDAPLRFTNLAHGLRADGSQFVGEMSWGIVRTTLGPVMFAIGRDISAQRRRARHGAALAALGEQALAGAALEELARTAAVALRQTLTVRRISILAPDHDRPLVSWGKPETPVTTVIPLITGDRDLGCLELAGALDELDAAFVRATANILALAAARLDAERHMRFRAMHDPLTGLANRTLLHDRLTHALAKRAGSTTVLFLDLDGFKQINDRFGHHAGDTVLATIAERLQGTVRPEDTIARFGGDEFVVVCEHLDAAGAERLATRLHTIIESPIVTDGHAFTPSISIGLASADHATLGADELIARADAAVYEAKTRGQGRTQVQHLRMARTPECEQACTSPPRFDSGALAGAHVGIADMAVRITSD